MSLWWVFTFYALERGLEVLIAGRNRRLLLARGGRELHPWSFRSIVLLHSLFALSLLIEAHPWRVPIDALTIACLLVLLLLQGLRYWCIRSLGPFWNTRIIVLPGATVRKGGPYRWLRHPNYLVVVLEFLFIPLLMRAPVTLIVFSLANLLLLRRRIALEEEALRECTDYDRQLSDASMTFLLAGFWCKFRG
jgi:methyltransferase